MCHIYTVFVSSIIVLSPALVLAADLVLETHAAEFMDELEQRTIADSADLETEGIQRGPRVTSRPVLFRAVKKNGGEAEMKRLAGIAGMEFDGEPVKRGRSFFLDNPNGTARIGYCPERGRYTYYSNALEKTPLEKTDSAALDELRGMADVLLAELINDEQRDFVFSNLETDWVQTKEDTMERICKRSFRYTRTVNGRYVIDQSAHVRITYSADGRVCAFSIENPTLVPEHFSQMVKPSATRARLAEYAENKQNAISPNGRKIGVKYVHAQRGYSTYVSSKIGETIYLVPHVSVLARHVLEDGREFSRYVYLSLDASEVPNLEPDMLERGTR